MPVHRLPPRPAAARLGLGRRRIAALWLLLGWLSLPAAAGAAPYAGRPLVEVLRELQAGGLTLIYNDQLVPPALRVATEPTAAGGIELLQQILAPLGLAARPAGPDAWSIVADPNARPRPAASAARPPAPAKLDEIVVTTSQYTLGRDNLGSRTTLTQDELQSLPALAGEPLRAVDRLPGAATNGLSGLANIRGGQSNETAIVLDGLTLTEPFHLKDFFSPVSDLDPAIVGSFDVYAGGFPVDFGGRMSAVVDVTSIEPPEDHAYELGLSLFHASGLASGFFDGGRGRWLVTGRLSNLHTVADLVNDELGEPKYLDSFLKVAWDLSDQTSVALRTLFAQDDIELNDDDQEEEADARYRNTYIWATLDHRWNDRLAGRALIAYTGIDNRRKGTVDYPGSRFGALDDQRDFQIGTLDLSLAFGDEALLFRGGLTGSILDGRYDYRSSFTELPGTPWPASAGSETVRNETPAPSGGAYGAFASARWRLTDRLTGEVGLRYDDQTYDEVDGGTQLAPRVNLLYQLDPATELRASWGRFFQAQGIDELQVDGGIDTFFPAQRADHAIISVEHVFADELHLRVEAYYKNYEELKPWFENQFNPLVLLPELQTDFIQVDADSGDARGVELLISRRNGDPWGWWLSYTWSRVEDDVGGVEERRSWDQRHSFNGGVNWTQGPWDITLAGTYHTGWPTTPVSLGPFVEGPAGPGDPVPSVILGTRNAANLDYFGSLDLRASYTFGLPESELLTFLEFTNLYGRRNPCCVEYTVVEVSAGEWQLRSDQDYWLRFVPNLGVLWRF